MKEEFYQRCRIGIERGVKRSVSQHKTTAGRVQL